MNLGTYPPIGLWYWPKFTNKKPRKRAGFNIIIETFLLQ